MNLGVLIALASLGFTALGAVAALIGIRQARSADRHLVAVDHKSARKLLRGRIGDPADPEILLSVISRFIFVSDTGRTTFGAMSKMESSVFLDLLTACTDLSLRKLVAEFVVNAVRDSATLEKPTHVAVAKEGNVLLADEVARQLNLGLIIVRVKLSAIRFGNPVEGLLPLGAYVIAVDDVAGQGEILVRVAQRIRRYGGRIEQAFCAVERLDGDAGEQLKARDVDLVSSIKIDEKTLRELRRLPMSSSNDDSLN